MIGVLVTTYNRPAMLERSLPQIAALGAPVLVVDDGSHEWWKNETICKHPGVEYLRNPQNRGLACALNMGLAYYFADRRITAVSYFQDDVDVSPEALRIMARIQPHAFLSTGHDAAEHAAICGATVAGLEVKQKWSCRATHMHASVDFWRDVFPIPTRELGAPKKNGAGRGIGSNVDWWVVRDAPLATFKRRSRIICVPGLVRTFSVEASDSCWNNAQRPEPPLREYA